MATDVTIEDYLSALHKRLRDHHARDDIVSEVEDHLRTTAERLTVSGFDSTAAESEAIRTFGDHEVLAEALLAANGAPAVPTTFTVAIGSAAVAGSALWIGLAVAFWSSHLLESSGRSEWEGAPRVLFMVGMAALAGGGVVTLFLMSALRIRLGGFGPTAMIGMVATGLATAASLVAWAIPLWSALFAVGCLPVAVTLLRQGAAPRLHTWVLAMAWPLGLSTLVVLRIQEFGDVDEWGDYPAAYLTGMTVGCLLMAAALVGLGRWLRSETPVDRPPARAAMA